MAAEDKGPALPDEVDIVYNDQGEVTLRAGYKTPEGMDPEAWRAQLQQVLGQVASGYADADSHDEVFQMSVEDSVEDDDDERVVVTASHGMEDEDKRETTMASATGMMIDILCAVNPQYAPAFAQYLQMRSSGMDVQPPAQQPGQPQEQP